jgi:hypothetical protein
LSSLQFNNMESFCANLRYLRPPLNAKTLRPLDERVTTVQFDEPLTDEEHKQVAKLLQDRPDVWLRAYGRPEGLDDLRFLRHYPFVRHIALDLYLLKRSDGVEHLADNLESFSFGQCKTKSISLEFLGRFGKLKSLSLEGHAKKLEVVGDLRSLRQLHLRSISASDLEFIKPLKDLRIFTLKLGGTTNLTALPALKKLSYLELWMVKGLCDLSVLGALRSLTHLYLQALAQVKELPSLASLESLRWVTIEALKNLHDLRPIAAAPQLEEISFLDMKQLSAESFRPFIGHRQLRGALIGLGSLKRNKEAQELLGVSCDVADKFQALEDALLKH